MCVFCKIIAKELPSNTVQEWDDAIAIVPLGPVVDGHVLVIPKTHVVDAVDDPEVTAVAMRRAAQYAKQIGSHNVIINVGKEAEQSVFHLHIHIVPRRPGDGLIMPWTGQKKH